MPNDLSVWTLVLDASPIVQAVVALLLVASVASWAVIFRKGQVIGRSRRQAEKFETAFWSGGDLATLYRNIETKGRAGTGLQSIFESGFGEFSRLRQQGVPAEQLLDGARRAMRVAQLRELDLLEQNLAILATVGILVRSVRMESPERGLIPAHGNDSRGKFTQIIFPANTFQEFLLPQAVGNRGNGHPFSLLHNFLGRQKNQRVPVILKSFYPQGTERQSGII